MGYGNMRQVIGWAGLLLALICNSANGDFSFSDSGPIGSDGDSFVGANDVAGGIYSNINFSGDLTEVHSATFASETRFRADGTHVFAFSTINSFDGTINIVDNRVGVFWAPANIGAVAIETFETFDDGNDGVADATWENLEFEMTGTPSIVQLGDFSTGSTFVFDTEGSTTLEDTELGAYDNLGRVIGTDDDGGTDTLSQLDLGVLDEGNYYIVMGAFNTIYDDYSATTTFSDSGDYNINLNGTSVDLGTLNAGDLITLQFSVSAVPEPSSPLVLLLGWLGLIARRNR